MNESIENNTINVKDKLQEGETSNVNEIPTNTDTVMNDIEKEEGEVDEEEEGMIVEEETQPTETIDKSLCQICKTNKWKYTCPKCSIHTCSLPCVKAHKKDFDCDGKRDKVKYVAMNVYNENNLRNDYYFLEDVARANDNANREQNDFRRNKQTQKKIAILKQAKKKDIILKFMPTGMKKSQINKIYFNIKAKEINWTIELNFPDSEKKVKLIRTRIRDNMKIIDILNNCLCEKEGNAMTRHNLNNYINEKTENLKVFMKREETPANKQEYFEVDINSTICETLAFKVIIEYPSFYILTPSSTFLDHAKIIDEKEQEELKQEIKKKQEEERKKNKNNNQKKRNNKNNNNNSNNNNNNSNDDDMNNANATNKEEEVNPENKENNQTVEKDSNNNDKPISHENNDGSTTDKMKIDNEEQKMITEENSSSVVDSSFTLSTNRMNEDNTNESIINHNENTMPSSVDNK
ncbi:hypothetical protein BCR36DRAFT_324107 [Piromyces finnis]|uniref:Box C/D snoRNA protein 1 n=1 Tax=Piromyces finnis TaxID=1754191 RepID=A0A1Y1VCS5_9FUNG|nr:hypothetical protein BCR36DRAFT_324107 [Piromyces finnis]|eukprot:ORX52996.1 hypothetical protein BCR36DRAFT_324107 [Piromyces finnis]